MRECLAQRVPRAGRPRCLLRWHSVPQKTPWRVSIIWSTEPPNPHGDRESSRKKAPIVMASPDHHRLNQRVLTFLRQFPGSEDLDALPPPSGHAPDQRADFLLNGRTAIAEVKEVRSDRLEPLRRHLSDAIQLGEVPLPTADTPLGEFLAKLPNGEALNRLLHEAQRDALEPAVRDANRQIRATRRAWGLPQAHGVLVLVNETADVLDPSVLGTLCGLVLHKKGPNGSRFECIDSIVCLGTTHRLSTERGLALPVFCVATDPRSDDETITNLEERLMQGWSDFLGATLEFQGDLTLQQVQSLQFVGQRPRPTLRF